MVDFLNAVSGQFADRYKNRGGLGNLLFGLPSVMSRQSAVEYAQAAIQKAVAQGQSPQQAIAGLFTGPDASKFFQPDVLTALKDVSSMLPQPGTPTSQQMNLAEFERRAGGTVPPEVAATALGIVPQPPDKLQVAAGLKQFLGRDPTEAELQNFFGLIQQGGTTVNVLPPDMGPVFNFLNKDEAAKRHDLVTRINTAYSSINDLITLSSSPQAKMLFGPIAKGANLTAPVADFFGFNQAFGIFGPDIKTLGEAKNKMATSLADAARLIIEQGGRDVSRRELELAGQVLANPDAFFTSASQVNEAAKLFGHRLQEMQTSNAGELSQGGVTPTQGTVNPMLNPEVNKRVVRRASQILQQKQVKNPTPDQMDDALDQATKEIIGQPAQ